MKRSSPLIDKNSPSGYDLFPIDDDGNCLFNAVAHQWTHINGNPPYTHEDLRWLAMQHIRSNQGAYRSFVTEKLDQYLSLMTIT